VFGVKGLVVEPLWNGKVSQHRVAVAQGIRLIKMLTWERHFRGVRPLNWQPVSYIHQRACQD
jgi:hypothetical protein